MESSDRLCSALRGRPATEIQCGGEGGGNTLVRCRLYRQENDERQKDLCLPPVSILIPAFMSIGARLGLSLSTTSYPYPPRTMGLVGMEERNARGTVGKRSRGCVRKGSSSPWMQDRCDRVSKLTSVHRRPRLIAPKLLNDWRFFSLTSFRATSTVGASLFPLGEL